MKDDPGRNLRAELGYLRDSLLDGIREGRTSSVADGLDMYEELVSAFLDVLSRYGSTYGRPSAIRELSTFEGGWSEIRWVEDDLRDIIDAAFAAGRMAVLRDITYFPVRLAVAAFYKGDYYVFHRSLEWVPYCYRSVVSMHAVETRSNLVELIWRYLDETGNLIIAPQFERATSTEEIGKQQDFAIGIILAFSRLAKEAFEHRELAHYEEFAGALTGLYDFIERQSTRQDTSQLQSRLETDALEKDERRRIEEKIALREGIAAALAKIGLTRNVVFFGLAAWFLRHAVAGDLDPYEWRRWQELTPLPDEMPELWELFLRASQHEESDELGWRWWEAGEHPERQGWTSSIEYDLERLFCVRALQVLAQTGESTQTSLRLTGSERIDYLAGEGAPFAQVLNQVETEPEKWAPLIGKDAIEAVPVLRVILEKSLNERQAAHAKVVLEAPVSKERVDKVKNNVIEGWKEDSSMRRTVQRHGNYEESGPAPHELTFFGINTTDLKELYVDRSRFTQPNWGDEYGRMLARGENDIVLAALRSVLTNTPAPGSDDELVDGVRRAIAELEAESSGEIVVLSWSSWFGLRALQLSDGFEQKLESTDHELLGWFDKIPVYRVHAPDDDEGVVVVDMKRAGVWHQYKPRQLLEGEEYLGYELTFLVREYDEDLARELIAKQPNLLRDREGNARTEADAIADLRQRVQMRVVEQFEYKLPTEPAGRFLGYSYP